MSRIARFAALGAAVALVGFSVPAHAAPGHTVTMTKHQHGTFVEKHLKRDPCTGDHLMTPGSPSVPGVQFTGNAVQHVTYFPGGDEVWFTFTETGRVAAVGTSGITYSGHATAWGNFNMNERNSNQTFTLSIRVSASDGSSFTFHQVTHITYNGNGDITVQFGKGNLTCS